MNDELLLQGALRALKTEFPSPRSTEEETARARRLVALMDEVVERGPPRARRWPFGLLAAAALVAVAGSVRWQDARRSHTASSTASAGTAASAGGEGQVTRVAGSVTVEPARAGAEHALLETEPLRRGSRVRLGPEAQARVRLGNGALVELAPRTELRLEGSDEGDALRLTSGRVELSVPPLRPRSLAVITPDARVTVVGTRFSVAVETDESGRALRTCVGVAEGRVAVASVSSSTTLQAGGSWSSDGRNCRGAAVPSPENAGPVPSAPTLRQRAPSAAGRPAAEASSLETSPSRHASAAPEANASQLAEQNQLFANALRAREHGNVEEARRLLRELLARFPEAVLAPHARQELSKARTLEEMR